MGVSRSITQSPRAYDLATFTAAQLGARLAAGANAALRTNLRTAQQDQGWHFHIHPNEEDEDLSAADIRFGFDIGDIRRHGAIADGATDCTDAIQTTLDCFRHATFPYDGGDYLVTEEILISHNNTCIEGDGRFGTRILFVPTANGACFKFENSGTTINQCSMSNVAIWSTDGTYKKTAIELVDISGCSFWNITIGGTVAIGSSGFWSGGSGTGSIGVHTRGRDTSGFFMLKAYCDSPIVISANPNDPAISIDHFNFHDTFLAGAGHPCVTIQAGVVLTQTSFTGHAAWVLGTGGLYWVDATSPGTSNGLRIDNLRYENCEDLTKYMVHIDVGSSLQKLMINGGQTALCRGFYLRNIDTSLITGFDFQVTGYEAMNANATCDQIILTGCFWQTGTTASLTGLTVINAMPSNTSMPLPSTGYIMPTPSTPYQEINQCTQAGNPVTLAANAKVVIGATTQTGRVDIVDDTDFVYGSFELRGTNHATSQIYDVSNFFSPTGGTADQLNVFWDATALAGVGAYVIENKYASSKTVRFTLTGRA